MQRSSFFLTIALLAGCDGARNADGNPVANNATASESAAGAVGDFKSPELAGLSVRDHPEGVQVATSPTGRGNTPPPIGTNDLLWSLSEGAVFTSVNGATVRDAKHFRELMDAIPPGQQITLGQQLFLEDAGNGMVSIRTSPPGSQ